MGNLVNQYVVSAVAVDHSSFIPQLLNQFRNEIY